MGKSLRSKHQKALKQVKRATFEKSELNKKNSDAIQAALAKAAEAPKVETRPTYQEPERMEMERAPTRSKGTSGDSDMMEASLSVKKKIGKKQRKVGKLPVKFHTERNKFQRKKKKGAEAPKLFMGKG